MKKIINSPNAPTPIGPYNQAILVKDTLYTSGQIAINPTTNELVLTNIESETKQVMDNLLAVLKSADMTFSNVIKSTIYITNMENFSIINEVYGTYFDSDIAPARETVEVSNLPKSVNVEISIIAVK